MIIELILKYNTVSCSFLTTSLSDLGNAGSDADENGFTEQISYFFPTGFI